MLRYCYEDERRCICKVERRVVYFIESVGGKTCGLHRRLVIARKEDWMM